MDSSSPEPLLPPGWEHFVPDPKAVSSPYPIPEKSVISSPETSGPPGWENTVSAPNALPDFVNLEKGTSSSPGTSSPPGQEVIGSQPDYLTGSVNLEKANCSCNSLGLSAPPRWEKLSFEPNYLSGPVNLEESMEISSPPCLKYTGPQAMPLSGNLQSLCSLPQTIGPPDCSNITPQPECMRCPLETPPLCLENTGSQPQPLSGNLHSTSISLQTSGPPDCGNTIFQPESMGCPLKTFSPPCLENTNPDPKPVSGNLQSTSSFPQTTGLPDSGNTTTHLKSMGHPLETPSPCLESTSPQPGPLSGSMQSMVSSPQTTGLPGSESTTLQHTLPSGSPNREKRMDSSPEMLQPPGWEQVGSQPIPAPVTELGQMICGSCRQLLSYPRGSIHVKCPCCQIINFVLEEHQVGNVKCGKCLLLLMYPYGAPAVRCSSCRFVTEVSARNSRPPLSLQQGRPAHLRS